MTKQKRLPSAYCLLLLAAAVIYGVLALSDNIWADEAYTYDWALNPAEVNRLLSA